MSLSLKFHKSHNYLKNMTLTLFYILPSPLNFLKHYREISYKWVKVMLNNEKILSKILKKKLKSLNITYSK